MADASTGQAVKKKPFIWLHDVAIAAGAGTTWRLYVAAAGEKLLMAKIWYTVIGATAFNIQFYKGDNALTTEISKLMSKANLPETANIAMGHVDAEEHHKILIGADAGDDFMLSRSGTAGNGITMDIQLFFEE